jgi:D-alanyl-D-alanine carboxypeptidase
MKSSLIQVEPEEPARNADTAGSPSASRWARPFPGGRRRRVAALVASALVLAGMATAPSSFAATDATKLQKSLDRIVDAGAPGAIVLVRDGASTIRLSSGFGNLAPKTPMRVADRSRIGSVTKSFTATVVLQLAAEKKLGLGDTVERWLPGVISNGDAISIRQLLNHTSGIYDYAGDPAVLAPYLQGNLTQVFDPQTGVEIAADHGPIFAPGSKLSYSNTNYLLLAMIVEAATGNTIATELRTRIFEPINLRHTSYATSSAITGSSTHGYIVLEDGPFDVTPWSPTVFGASGAIVSNADDVARFYRALLQGRLLPAKLLKSMRTIDPVATGGVPDAGILGGGWGLGLLREKFPCGQAWGHDAENPGYMTAAWNSKTGNRQVVVVVNSNFSHDEPVSRAMRNVLATAYCGR